MKVQIKTGRNWYRLMVNDIMDVVDKPGDYYYWRYHSDYSVLKDDCEVIA